jgi:hypothetical protein
VQSLYRAAAQSVSKFREKMQRNKEKTQQIFQEKDERFIHQFVLNFRWNQWLTGKDIGFLTGLIEKPKRTNRDGTFVYVLQATGV